MKNVCWLLIFIVISGTLPGWGGTVPQQNFPCANLNKIWFAKFMRDFKVGWTSAPFDCRTPSLDFIVAQAMDDLFTTSFKHDPSAHPTAEYDWVTGLVTKTLYTDSDATYPFAVANTSKTGILTLHKSFLHDDPAWQTSVFYHEVRHATPSDPGHVMCDAGTNKGKMACDVKFYETSGEGGGYNYQFNYLNRVLTDSHHTDLDNRAVAVLLKILILNNFNGVTNDQVKKWAR